MKIVIKVEMHCKKCRSKALQIAASSYGVISVALEGNDKDKVVVVGEEVDAVELTKLLTKKVNYARLESVEEVKPPKKKDENKGEEKKKDEEKKKNEKKGCSCPTSCDPRQPRCELYGVAVSDPDPPPFICSIM